MNKQFALKFVTIIKLHVQQTSLRLGEKSEEILHERKYKSTSDI